MDTDRLGVFRAVAREGGFSRAATRLHRTQPAVSQAIKALEEELGERLFLRAGRQTKLTAAGQILLESVESAFAHLDHARARLAARRELTEGELHIGSSDTVTCYALPALLARFRDRHPGVELRISNRPSSITVEQVAAGEVDIGFVTAPTARGGLRYRALTRLVDVAICAPQHPLAARRRVTLRQLAAQPLLVLDRGAATRNFLDGLLGEAGLKANIAMELASIEAIKRLVRLDFGVSLVPSIAVAEEVAAGTLCALPVVRRDRQRALGAIHREGAPLPRAAQVFLELAQSELRAELPRGPG